MNMEIDNFLKGFVSKDYLKSTLLNPIEVGEFVYATNGNILVKVPKSIVGNKYKEDSKFPDCESVIRSTPLLNESLTIETEKLKELLSSIPLYDVYEECAQCEGEGTIECECCGHDGDCEDCDGSGTTSNTIGKEFNFNTDIIKIHEGLFNPNFITKILEASELEKQPIKVLSNSPNRAMICEIGRITVLIAPKMHDPDADYNIHEIKTEQPTS